MINTKKYKYILDNYNLQFDTPVVVDKELTIELTHFEGEPMLLLARKSEGNLYVIQNSYNFKIIFYIIGYGEFLTFLPLNCIEWFIHGLDHVLKIEDTSMLSLFNQSIEVRLGENNNISLHMSTSRSRDGTFFRAVTIEKKGPSKMHPFWIRFESLDNLLKCLKSLVSEK